MIIGKSLKIAALNWKVMLKSILCQIVIAALVFSLAYVTMSDTVKDIVDIYLKNNLGDFIGNTFKSILDGSFDSDAFVTDVTALLAQLRYDITAIRNHWGSVELSYVLFFVIFVLYRVLLSLTDVTVGCQIEEFMTSNARGPFTWFFVKKQGETWLFAILQAVVALPLDLLIIFGTLGFYLTYLVAFASWTIIPAVIIGAVLFALRTTLTSFCLPSVVCNSDTLGVEKSFRLGISAVICRFWSVFWKNLLAVALIFALVLVSASFVKNATISFLIVTVPSLAIFFVLKCLNFTQYFETTDRSFFSKKVDIYGTASVDTF